MTKSTITREESAQAVFDLKVGYRLGFADIEILKRVARMALAAMDSEPVAGEARFKEERPRWTPCTAEHVSMVLANPEDWPNYEVRYLYAAPQPTPVVPAEPDKELSDDVLDGIIAGAKTSMEQYLALSLKAEREAWRQGEPTDDERIMAIEGIHNCERCGDEGWVVGEMGITRCTCSQDGALTSEDAKQFEPVTTANKLGNSPVIPEDWQVEAERLAEMHGMSFVLFRHGEAPQCADPTKVVISFTDKGLGHDTLPAAPQEVQDGK